MHRRVQIPSPEEVGAAIDVSMVPRAQRFDPKHFFGDSIGEITPKRFTTFQNHLNTVGERVYGTFLGFEKYWNDRNYFFLELHGGEYVECAVNKKLLGIQRLRRWGFLEPGAAGSQRLIGWGLPQGRFLRLYGILPDKDHHGIVTYLHERGQLSCRVRTPS